MQNVHKISNKQLLTKEKEKEINKIKIGTKLTKHYIFCQDRDIIKEILSIVNCIKGLKFRFERVSAESFKIIRDFVPV